MECLLCGRTPRECWMDSGVPWTDNVGLCFWCLYEMMHLDFWALDHDSI